MNRKDLSRAFKALLMEFGTHRAALEVLRARGVTRVSERDLSEYAKTRHDRTPPVHIVAELEGDCGKPIVSGAMQASVRGVSVGVLDLSLMASQAVMQAAMAGNHVTEANSDRIITPRELDEITAKLRKVISQAEALITELTAQAQAPMAAE